MIIRNSYSHEGASSLLNYPRHCEARTGQGLGISQLFRNFSALLCAMISSYYLLYKVIEERVFRKCDLRLYNNMILKRTITVYLKSTLIYKAPA
jgi:hypothetical protein